MLVVILTFIVLLLASYAAWHLLPPPADVIVAVIVAIVAAIYLVANLGTFEEADAAVAASKALRSSWGALLYKFGVLA